MAKQNTTDTTTTTNINPDVKSKLDLAWGKIEDGLQQEAEGHNLWIEGTLELINILDDARKRLGDQEFGTWLSNSGYGDRITRHDRQALQNMALDLNVTLAAYLGKRNSTPLEIPVAHRWATGRWREPRRSVSRTHTRWQ